MDQRSWEWLFPVGYSWILDDETPAARRAREQLDDHAERMGSQVAYEFGGDSSGADTFSRVARICSRRYTKCIRILHDRIAAAETLSAKERIWLIRVCVYTLAEHFATGLEASVRLFSDEAASEKRSLPEWTEVEPNTLELSPTAVGLFDDLVHEGGRAAQRLAERIAAGVPAVESSRCAHNSNSGTAGIIDDSSERVETTEDRSARRCAVVEPFLKKKGWTRSRWATKSGVGKATVYCYMNGSRSYITIDNRKAMAEELGIPEQELPE